MKLFEKVRKKLEKHGWNACRCTNADKSEGTLLSYDINDVCDKALVGDLKEHDSEAEGVYLEISDCESCLAYREFPEESDADTVLLAIADEIDRISEEEGIDFSMCSDALVTHARETGVYEQHKMLRRNLREQLFIYDVAIPFIRKSGRLASSAMARDYGKHLDDCIWLDDRLPSASIYEKAGYIRDFLFSLDNCPEAVKKTWESMVKEYEASHCPF